MTNKDKPKWERQTGETARNYEYFEKYLQLGTTRSLKKLHRKYPESTPKKRRLNTISTTWDWVARSEAYDIYRIDQRQKRYDEKLDAILEKEFETLQQRQKIINDNMDDLSKEEKSTSTGIAHAIEKNTKAYKTNMEQLFLIAGRPSEITEQKQNIDLHDDTNKEDAIMSQELLQHPSYIDLTMKILEDTITKREEKESDDK